MEAGKKGDWEGYKRRFSQATLKQHQQTAKDAGITLEEYYKSEVPPDFKIPEMRNEKRDGDNATIELKVEEQARTWVRIPFVKEDGEWKIATAERANDVKVITESDPNEPPQPGGHISDAANVIDGESEQRAEAILDDLKKRRAINFLVATVKTTGNEPIEGYARTLARMWGLKGTSRGILLLLATDDRKYQFEISGPLEGELSSDDLKQAGQVMTPSLREGNYGEGMLKAVHSVIMGLEDSQKK